FDDVQANDANIIANTMRHTPTRSQETRTPADRQAGMLGTGAVRPAAFLLALSMGCTGAAEAPAEGGPTRSRIGYAPIADCAHLYAASEQKLWAEHHLEV